MYEFSLANDVVENVSWERLYMSEWKGAEAIHMLEARCSYKALCHAVRTEQRRDTRLLLLCDNLAAVCAFNKGRAHCLPLQRLCRRIAATVVCTGTNPRWRYIESKRNPADEGTRPSDADRVETDGVDGHHKHLRPVARPEGQSVGWEGARRPQGRHM